MADRFKSLTAQTDAYIENWQQAHYQAIACRDLEDELLRGVKLFDFLCAEEEKWRSDVLNHREQYSPTLEKFFLALFELWSRPCQSLLEAIARVQAGGFEVEHAAEFESRCREVKGILTADHEFFDSDELAEVRDKAIDDHRRGLTIEHRPA